MNIGEAILFKYPADPQRILLSRIMVMELLIYSRVEY